MRPLARVSAFAAGRRSRWVVIGVWVAAALALAPLQPKLQEEAADESETFIVRGSESAEFERIVDERFRAGSEMAAVVAYFREGGITARDRSRIQADALEVCRSAAIPSLIVVGTPYGLVCGEQDPLDLSPGGPGLSVSGDGSVVLGAALMTDGSTQVAEAAAAAIRAAVPPPAGDETGLRAYVTGEAGFDADRSAAVEGIDDTLLLVTVAVLLALLLAIYRSPLVAAVPLVVVALAYLIAAGLIYGLVAADLTTVSGQTTAILIVLMFGVGTDYCLLIVARYRDELRTTERSGHGDGPRDRADRAGHPHRRRDRRRRDARPRGRRLQRHPRDGPAARPGGSRHGRRRPDPASRRARRAGTALVLARDPARGDHARSVRRDVGARRRPGGAAPGGGGRSGLRDPGLSARWGTSAAARRSTSPSSSASGPSPWRGSS